MESLPVLHISWFALGSFALIQTILLMVCDADHRVPRWSLRLFLGAVTLQSLGIIFGAATLVMAAQFVSAIGIAWIIFGLVQDIKVHRRNHQV